MAYFLTINVLFFLKIANHLFHLIALTCLWNRLSDSFCQHVEIQASYFHSILHAISSFISFIIHHSSHFQLKSYSNQSTPNWFIQYGRTDAELH